MRALEAVVVRIGVALVLVVAFGSSGRAETMRGRVVDAESGKPIEGAVVLGVWTKVAGLPGLQHHELLGVHEVATDSDGRFELPRLRSLDMDEDGEAITVYKFGYVAWSNRFTFPPIARRKDRRVPPEVRLQRFPPSLSHRRHLSFIEDSNLSGSGYEYDSIQKFRQALEPEIELTKTEPLR